MNRSKMMEKKPDIVNSALKIGVTHAVSIYLDVNSFGCVNLLYAVTTCKLKPICETICLIFLRNLNLSNVRKSKITISV